ncbi:23S rRNA (pseudouridine(1915)-N(3))-methyltransferase RlmH, partial [Candidatus Woesearchaeota archaeon]|nr:23S rRNA (pseudouridine(1915)-N(3))-methyltransferase RlmH [Candidatus Woesearchaeota archaeon]
MKLLCVDKVKEKYIKEGIEDFLKRINYFGKFEILRI